MSSEIRIKERQTLSEQKYKLEQITFSYHDRKGKEQQKTNEVYDIGDAVTALLYNPQSDTVILTRQLRLVAFLANVPDGKLIEACAGKLEDEDAEAGMKREIEEETGYTVQKLEKAFEGFSTPGAVKELLHCFIAEYAKGMKTGSGGGLESEQEEIQVLELPLDSAINMIRTGEIKDLKTIALLQHLKLRQLSSK